MYMYIHTYIYIYIYMCVCMLYICGMHLDGFKLCQKCRPNNTFWFEGNIYS